MRRSLALVFLSIVTLSIFTACSGETHQINVTAPDAADRCGLYVSAARANAYGKNALADGTVLAAQAGMSIPVDAIGDYDLKLVACDGREEVMPVNVPLSGSALIPPVCRSAHGGVVWSSRPVSDEHFPRGYRTLNTLHDVYS